MRLSNYLSMKTLSKSKEKTKTVAGTQTGKRRKKNKEVNLMRARREIRNYINSNDGYYPPYKSTFLTLTFRENLTDIKKANNHFKKFILRLNYKTGHKIKYITVIEFQKRGAVHYHTIFFNLPFRTDLQTIWGQGYIKIKALEKVDNVGAYICKYLQKEHYDDRLQGKKKYFKK